jgi:hypothetical protein
MRISALLLILLFLSRAAAAGTLQGAVRDGKGAPLPFATVYVAGTTFGSVANASGFYSVSLDAGSYIVTCQYIGYQQSTFNLSIGKDEVVKHDFRLSAQSLSIGEVVVRASDEDPAYRIIREAIKKRPFHFAQVQQFQTGIYMKGVLRTRETPDEVMGQKIDKGEIGADSSGKGVLYLCEEMATYYAQRDPERVRTVIHSVKESGDPNGLGFSQLPPVISFYANNVISLNNSRPLISPISDGALAHYKYRLEGEFKEGRNTIYKIKVIPKHAYSPLCFGHIYIVDGDWAIHSLSLATSARYGLETLDTLRIDQVFLPLRKDVWVIKNQQLYPTLNIFGFGITGNFVTVYDNQKVNEPVPDTIFNKKIISTYDKTANKKDSAYWEDTRPIPLEDDEARDYRYKDSLRLALDNPQRTDSLRRRENRVGLGELLLTGMDFDDSGYRNRLHISALPLSVNFNSVEGVNVTPEFSWRHRIDTGESVSLRTALRYGFSNTHFNGIAALHYQHDDRRWLGRSWSLTAEGGKYVFQYDRHNPIVPLFNSVTTLLFNYNPLKIYERWTGALQLRRNCGNGLRWWLRGEYAHRLPLENTTDFTWGNKESEVFTDNLPDALEAWHGEEQDAVLLRVGLAWQPGYRYVEYPDYRRPVAGNAPVFMLQYDKGLPGLFGSDVNWDKWRASMEGRLSLRRLGAVDYMLAGGGFLNKSWVGLPDLMYPFAGDDASLVTLATPYLRSFQAMPLYWFCNDADAYAEAHVEYNMLGLLSNKIPGIRQAQWFFVIGNNTFYAGDKLYYTEVFFSFDHIGYKMLRPLRLDFVRGWDQDRKSYDGIRLGIKIEALSKLREGGADTEW